MIDLRWSGSPAAIDAALTTLGYPDTPDPRVLAFGPVTDATVAGQPVRFALIRASEDIPAPAGVFDEPGAVSEGVVGVFMEGPSVVNPSPLEWMDRISRETQARLYAAAQASPALGFFLFRLGAAREVDPAHPETIAGVDAAVAAGLLTAEDRRLLLGA